MVSVLDDFYNPTYMTFNCKNNIDVSYAVRNSFDNIEVATYQRIIYTQG